MLLYDGAKPEGQRQWKQSTKRRAWEEAEQVRREWLVHVATNKRTLEAAGAD
jgi:hypothetical protein